jgi:hypothetical protein
MHALSAAELLNVWERGLSQSQTERALTLLSAACPEAAPESLAKLSVGNRDALLMTLREWTFGSQLRCVATCSRCGEKLELNFSVSELRLGPAATSTDPVSLSFEGYELSFRLPNSQDLAAVAHSLDLAAGRQLLLDRCISSVEFNGERIAEGHVPARVLKAVEERMGELDLYGDVQLTLNCPHCKNDWRSIFDIEAFFWKEISAWATRILKEVHTLAAAYGWSEVDILNMSHWRRQIYLNLVS